MTRERLFRIAAWLCLLVIVALSLVSPSMRPVTWLPHNIEHVAIFAIAGCAMGLGYPHRATYHLVGLVIFAAAIEVAQSFAPGRHARLIDFVVDSLGACAGVVVAMVITKLLRPAARES